MARECEPRLLALVRKAQPQLCLRCFSGMAADTGRTRLPSEPLCTLRLSAPAHPAALLLPHLPRVHFFSVNGTFHVPCLNCPLQELHEVGDKYYLVITF